MLSWPPPERRSDRYGLVGLSKNPMEDFAKLTGKIPVKQHGRLVAVVLETRDSHHIGDLFRGIFPSTPNVGDRISLGEGTLFTEEHCVGLKPDDGRYNDWLNPYNLYRAHDQTVRLIFKPL